MWCRKASRGAEVGRHGVAAEEAGDDLSQPTPLLGDWAVHLLTQLVLDRLELRPQAVAAGLPMDQKASSARCSTDEGEA
jgi:hypothetical protein